MKSFPEFNSSAGDQRYDGMSAVLFERFTENNMVAIQQNLFACSLMN